MSTKETDQPTNGQSPGAVALSTWLCFVGLLVGQFIAVLDVQIVASSLTMIQAGVGAARDEISWVQTSYLIAETLAIPLVGYLTKKIGLRALFSAACGSFVVFSLLVGSAHSLAGLVVARALQGAAGGLMLPIAFTYGFASFPAPLKSRISLILALCSVLAPAIGPVLGGWLSDVAGWRWLFFLNVAPGAVAMLIVYRSAAPRAERVSSQVRLDWRSLLALSACLASTEFVLEEGQRRNWTEDGVISALIIVGAVGLLAFLRSSAVAAAPLIDLRPLLRHDFRTGWLMITVSGVSMFGGSYLLPLFLAEVRGYTPLQVGETLLVSGATMVIGGLLLVPRLRRLDTRLLVGGGFALTGYAFWLGRAATAEWDFWEFAALQVWRGIGLIVAVTATQNLAMAGVGPTQASSATSLLFLSRNLGGAFGVSLLSSELVGGSRQAYSDLSMSYVAGTTPRFGTDSSAAVADMFDRMALVLGFNRCFALVAVYCWAASVLATTLPGHRAGVVPEDEKESGSLKRRGKGADRS